MMIRGNGMVNKAVGKTGTEKVVEITITTTENTLPTTSSVPLPVTLV
jgi:hypothetical protein